MSFWSRIRFQWPIKSVKVKEASKIPSDSGLLLGTTNIKYYSSRFELPLKQILLKVRIVEMLAVSESLLHDSQISHLFFLMFQMIHLTIWIRTGVICNELL